MRATPLDIAAVIEAALRGRCQLLLPKLTAISDLCDECRELPERVLERLHTGIHPDALAALATRIFASHASTGGATH